MSAEASSMRYVTDAHAADRAATESLELPEGTARARRMHRWAPTEIEVVGDELRYVIEPSRARQSEGVLEAFVGISDGSDAASFAKRFGVLHLCRHGLPETHRQPYDVWAAGWELMRDRTEGPVSADNVWPFVRLDRSYCISNERLWCRDCDIEWDETTGCPQCGTDSRQLRGSESVAAWLELSGQARASLAVGSALSAGDEPKRDDLVRIRRRHHQVSERPSTKDAQAIFQGHLEEWLHIGGIGFSLDWNDDGPSAVLSRPTFGMIALEIMSAVVGTSQPDICDSCGQVYFPERKPYANRPNTYCQPCRTTGKADRVRQQRYRDRKRNEASR